METIDEMNVGQEWNDHGDIDLGGNKESEQLKSIQNKSPSSEENNGSEIEKI